MGTARAGSPDEQQRILHPHPRAMRQASATSATLGRSERIPLQATLRGERRTDASPGEDLALPIIYARAHRAADSAGSQTEPEG